MSKMFDDFKELMLNLISFEVEKVGGNVEERTASSSFTSATTR